MVIDIHSHFLPDVLVDYIRRKGDALDTQVVIEDGREYLSHKEGFKYPVFREFYDYGTRIADMDKMGVDKAILSLSPSVFYYFIDREEAAVTSAMCNDWLADFVSRHPDRLGGMATLPMQDIALSLKELKRAHTELGMKGIEIAPVILDRQLDDEVFFPIYDYCASNGIVIFLHPYYPGYPEARSEYANYYNKNLVGNVYETNCGLNHLVLGGVFERFPALSVIASHGGGYFPYQAGRLVHGYKVRQEPKALIHQSPEHYFKNLYFDTITHWNPALQFLSDSFGADHVLVGTDYPFDMGDDEPVTHVNGLRLTRQERESILHGNAEKLFL